MPTPAPPQTTNVPPAKAEPQEPMIFPLGTMRKAHPPIKAEVDWHMTNSKGAVLDEACVAAAKRGLVAFRCGSCTVQPFERMAFITQYQVDMANWKLSVPKDTHERLSSPFPTLGPYVLDGHPKS